MIGPIITTEKIYDLPDRGITVICYDAVAVKWLTTYYPDWTYIKTSTELDCCTLSGNSATLLVVVGDAAESLSSLEIGDVPMLIVSAITPHEILHEICLRCMSPSIIKGDIVIENTTLGESTDCTLKKESYKLYPAVPPKSVFNLISSGVGVLVVGKSERQISKMKKLRPGWWFTSDLDYFTISKVNAHVADLVILLDEGLLKEYYCSDFWYRGVPVVAKEDGVFVAVRKTVESCDDILSHLI